MRIVEIREVTKPIASPIRNAYIDFSQDDASLVAVVTDVVRDGAGRRLRLQLERPLRPGRADPRALPRPHPGGRAREPARRERRQPRSAQDLGDDDDEREARRPRRALGGGRHARHGGLGRGGQDRRQAAVPPAGRAPGRARPTRKVFVYAAGGYYYPGKDNNALRAEMRSYLDRGYNVVKMKIGGASIAEDQRRIEAVLAEIGCQGAARGRRERPLRPRDRHRLCQDAARLPAVLVRGGRRSAGLSRCRPRCPNSIRARWRPARTCSRTRMPATCCATAACGRTATGCSSIARCRYGLVEYLRTLEVLAVRLVPSAASRMAATRCR